MNGNMKIIMATIALGVFFVLAAMPAAGAVSGELSTQEVVLGGRTNVKYKGLTKGTSYSIEVAGETASNFTATGTTFEKSLLILNTGSNAIVLYESDTHTAKVTLYCYGVEAQDYFGKDLFMGVFQLAIMATILVAIVVGIWIWIGGGIKF